MYNRKEFISRIFSKDTIVDAVKSIKSAGELILPEEKSGVVSDSVHIPELAGDMVYFEAMKLGIDPSNFTVEDLKKRVLDELSGAGQR